MGNRGLRGLPAASEGSAAAQPPVRGHRTAKGFSKAFSGSVDGFRYNRLYYAKRRRGGGFDRR